MAGDLTVFCLKRQVTFFAMFSVSVSYPGFFIWILHFLSPWPPVILCCLFRLQVDSRAVASCQPFLKVVQGILVFHLPPKFDEGSKIPMPSPHTEYLITSIVLKSLIFFTLTKICTNNQLCIHDLPF